MTDAELDEILTLQLAFSWAGEGSPDPDDRRLAWWRTDLISEYGGLALLGRLAPRTAEWAAYQAARAAAIKVDARARQVDADADDLLSLFHLGHPADEELDDRLDEHKASGKPPAEALPRLGELISGGWNPDTFKTWLDARQPPKHDATPAGLRIKGSPPTNPSEQARALAAVLAALPKEYSCPHFRDDSSG